MLLPLGMNRLLLSAVFAAVAIGCGAPIDKCSQKTFGGPFCVPDSGIAAPGRTLTFQVIDVCNGGCGKSSLACVVARDAGTITVTVAGEVCEPPAGVACSLACALRPLSCTLPPLEEGDYTVVSPNQASQAFHVRDGGSAECTASTF